VEQEDALAVIAWIAAQPWCSGAVGMLGKSGAVSARSRSRHGRPPALRAVVVVCATDDRWSDDAHYMGGCLLNENLTWGTRSWASRRCPPTRPSSARAGAPRGAARLEGLVPFPALWMQHPRRDAYWRRGSAGEDLARITCPVYAVGGWADAYASAVPRLVAGLGGPRKGLIGPWAHVYPYAGRPGPPIHFLGEALRWWDQWLRGIETGVMFEPMLRVWMQEGARPMQPEAPRAGRWVAEPEWPSPRITVQRWALGRGRLDADRGAPERIDYARTPSSGSRPATGATSWARRGASASSRRTTGARHASTRRRSRSASRSSERRWCARAGGRSPAAQLAVRLNEVTPEGSSTRVTYGLFDLAQLAKELGPGRRVHVRLPPARRRARVRGGHCIRCRRLDRLLADRLARRGAGHAVAVHGGEPPRAARPPTPRGRRGAPPLRAARERAAPRAGRAVVRPGDADDRRPRRRHHALPRRERGRRRGLGGPCRIVATGVEVVSMLTREYRLRGGDPLSATAEVVQRTGLRSDAFDVRVEVRSRLTATREAFRYEADVRAEEVGAEVTTRRFDLRIPRPA
jgi:putative CocE/NonD family hydrolase